MKRNLFNIGFGIVVIALIAVIGIVADHLMVAAGVAIALTGAPVTGDVGAGTVTTGKVKEGSPDLDQDYVSKLVTEMRPAATPLDTILRNIRKATPIKSWRTEYYAVDSRPLYDTMAAAWTETDGTNGHLSGEIEVANIHMWVADDTLFIPTVNGGDGKGLVCFVVSKTVATSKLLIQPLNGLTGKGNTDGKVIMPASIPDTTRLVRMATCKDELAAQTSPYAMLPVKEYNYVQRYMAQVEESIYQRLHQKEVDWGFTDYEAQNIYDMKATIEQTGIFGVRAQFTDVTNNIERYATGGITRFITKGLEYGTGGVDRSIDNNTFVDWTQTIFSANSGSQARYLFGGHGLMANLNKVDTVLKQIQGKSVAVKFGLTFKEIETNFGLLYFYHHPMLDQAGWSDNGLVLDLAHLEKHTWRPLATKTLDLITSGQRNANAVILDETSGWVLRYPDTHAIIRPKA
jgi:hypothetical protein